jgi:hypothetical protein
MGGAPRPGGCATTVQEAARRRIAVNFRVAIRN